MCHLTMEYILRNASLGELVMCKHHLHRPRWVSLLHAQTVWSTLSLLGYKLVQRVPVQTTRDVIKPTIK